MKRKRKKTRHKKNSLTCSFCNDSIESLPHKCKYCGELHCSEHILPESHECKGISKLKEGKWIIGEKQSLSSAHISKKRKDYWSNSPSQWQNKKNYRRNLPRIKISRFFKALTFAILTFFVSSYWTNGMTLFIELIAWSYFAWVVYNKAFLWANRVSMADDLSFWGLRILGILVVIVGAYIGFFSILAAIFVKGSAPAAIPLFSFLIGLILLGAFIAFRTNRRHKVIGIWSAE